MMRNVEHVERPKGPSARSSLTTIVVGAVIAIPCTVVMGLAFWSLVFGTTYKVPGTARVHLHEGKYIVFENTATTSSFGVVSFTHGHGVSIDASQVTVTGDDGTNLVVHDSSPTQSISRNSDQYVAAVDFTTPHAGDYVLRFDTPVDTKVMVQPPLGDLFTRRVPWVLGFGVGWIVMIVGIAMLITGANRRRRVARVTASPMVGGIAAPPQWFPDPQGQRRLRYWDGSVWTEYTAD